MNSSLLDKKLNEDSYGEYIEKIINIFRLSSKESSILLDLKIKDYKCVIKLSIVGQNGEKEEFCDTTLKCDEVFYKEFLDVLIEEFTCNVAVTTKDIVDLDDDPSLVTFRLITVNNDLFSIDGLTIEHAKYLFSLVEREKKDRYLADTRNSAGIANANIFLLVIVMVILIFIIIYFIVK